MNYMESGRGFYEGGSKFTLPFSQSSSSRQKAQLTPFSYNHHQQPRPAWIEDNNQESLSHQQTELTMGGRDDSKDHQVSATRGGGESSMEVIEREHMFDKVVTPSDVGKLNRLVIPKQDAEKYFPLDSSTSEKGLLLNFEDRNGKPWRFRYSYWKSSQSYVMTKGWSRFVKEKKLDARDVVSFQRGVGEFAKDRLFIDWRRQRPEPPNYPHDLPQIPAFSLSSHFSLRPWNHQYQPHPRLVQPNYPLISPHHFNTYSPYNSYGSASVYGPGASSVVYLRPTGATSDGGGGVGASQQQVGMMPIPMTMPIPPSMVYESVPVVQRMAAPKKLRLFGVNMECAITENTERTFPHFSTITPSHRPNSSTPSLSSLHQTNPQIYFQEYPNDDKGKSSNSLDLDI